MINKKYERAYESYKKLYWVDDPFGLLLPMHVNGTFMPLASEEATAVFRTLYPKRKTVNLALLSEDILEPIREKWRVKARIYVEQKVRQRELLRDWLNKNAGDVELIAAVQVVYSQSPDTYRSQGMGADSYAKGDVKRRGDLLSKYDIPYTIERRDRDFVLLAPLTPYMLDALERRDNGTLLEWAISCWRNGQNPKVLSPFLPDSIYEQSMKVVYG